MDQTTGLSLVDKTLDWMRGQARALILADKRGDILNERFWHHMFSWKFGQVYEQRFGAGSYWTDLILVPEQPTGKYFRRKGIHLNDAVATRQNAIRDVPTKGFRAGNIDFGIRTDPPIAIEWKGPKLYSDEEITEAILKLLSEPHRDAARVFAALVTTNRRGDELHRSLMTDRCHNAVEFAKDVLNWPSGVDPRLHVYAAAFYDSNSGRPVEHVVCWGSSMPGHRQAVHCFLEDAAHRDPADRMGRKADLSMPQPLPADPRLEAPR